MSQSVSMGTRQVAIYNALVPPEGPKSVQQSLDFTNGITAIELDFTLAYFQQVMSAVQSCWINNGDNTETLTITCVGTGQVAKIPPGFAGSIPIIANKGPKLVFSTTGNLLLSVLLLNVPIPAAMWPANGETATIGAVTINAGTADIGTIHVSGTVPVSGAIAGTVTLAAGAADVGTIHVAGTVPVSGTVGLAAGVANIGTVAVAGGVSVGAVTLAAGAADVGTVHVSGTVPVSGTVALGAGAAALGTVAVSGTVPVSGTVSAIAAGAAASGVAVAGNPVLMGGRAENVEATAVANGQAVDWALDLVGRGIVFPYANKENIVQGSISTTGTGAATLVASPGASLSIYVTSLQFSNSGTAATVVTLNDSASSQFIVPAGGGNNLEFPLPLKLAANTALTMTGGTATTTLIGNAQGFKGT